MTRSKTSKPLLRHPDSAHRVVGDEGALVVLPTQSEVKVLNPVGSKIFTLLDGKHTEEQIVESVMEEFDVTEQEARGDLDRFLDDLEAAGMLAENGGNSG